MPNHRDRKLEQLAVMAQLMQAFGGSQQGIDHSEIARLGLAQQDKHEQMQDAIARLGLGQRDRQENMQDTLARLGLTQQGNHQQAMEALGLRQANSQDEQTKALIAHQSAMERQAQAASDMQSGLGWEENRLKWQNLADMNQARKEEALAKIESEKQANVRAMISSYFGRPDATPTAGLKLAAAAGIPGADTMVDALSQESLHKNVAAIQQMMAGPYAALKAGKASGQAGLDAIYTDPKMLDEAVQSDQGLHAWINQQNASLYDPLQTSAPSTQIGTGLGAVLGHAIRNAPGAVASGLQNADSAMTEMGGNFWANLLGLKPMTVEEVNKTPIRPWGPFSR